MSRLHGMQWNLHHRLIYYDITARHITGATHKKRFGVLGISMPLAEIGHDQSLWSKPELLSQKAEHQIQK